MFRSTVRILFPAVVALAILTGCPANLNRVPGSTESVRENDSGGKYLMYVPSWHSNEKTWPIVVTCHGTIPWDTADLQMREWRGLAERVGFIVIAPRLTATNGIVLTTTSAQLKGQLQDEKLILNAVNKAIRSLNGDRTRVYMAGWSGGGYAVYHTGVRNPDVFRALVVRMGTFKEKYLPDVASRIDPYQPASIFFGSGDPLPGINKQCRQAYEFLKSHGSKRIKLREITGGHRRRPELAFEVFKAATDRYAFVKLSAVTDIDGDGLTVKFYLTVDPEPKFVLWEFGDDTTSTDLQPLHTFRKSDTYTVTVTIVTPKGTKTQRQLTVKVVE